MPISRVRALVLNLEEPRDNAGRVLPGRLFRRDALPAGPGERVHLDRAPAVRLSPRGPDPARLLQFEQGWIQRALIQRQVVAADLLDPSGDAISVKRAERFERLENDETEAAVEHVGPFVVHVLAEYI
jgi:hypothetical protein